MGSGPISYQGRDQTETGEMGPLPISRLEDFAPIDLPTAGAAYAGSTLQLLGSTHDLVEMGSGPISGG
jgi:hypothetical protein